MFTGLIEEVGSVRAVGRTATGADVTIDASLVLGDLAPGDSVACNGCCLTATRLVTAGFCAHAGAETLDRSTVGAWAPGAKVNLERALSPRSRLGGHFVQGHVDGVARVVASVPQGETTRWRFTLPEALGLFVVEKGSIAVDGISLTVTSIAGDAFEVAVIPHTLEHTTLGTLRPGDPVNIEVDILAKYVQRMVAAMGLPARGLTEDFLREHGFS